MLSRLIPLSLSIAFPIIFGLYTPPTEAKKSSVKCIKKIQTVLKKYKSSKAVKMNVEKKIVLALLEQENISSGFVFFSAGRLRMEINKPEPVLLVMDGKNIWLETVLPKEFGGKIQVAKISTAGRRKKANTILALLFDDKDFWKNFRVIKSQSKNNHFYCLLKPKKGQPDSDIKKLKIVIHSKTQEITEVSYWDELDNVVTYKFKNINFNVKISKKKFIYTPPADAEITVY